MITGGAIKVTCEMKDHESTRQELKKIEKAKTWLKTEGIVTEETLIYYYDETDASATQQNFKG